MNDELLPPTDPTLQPVSMHETPHKHNGALPLITAMLGVFLVLETIAIGYGVTQLVGFKDRVEAAKQTAAERRAEIEQKVAEAKAKIPPILYIKSSQPNSLYGQELHQVDRQTGQDTLVMDFGASKAAQLVAVPQVGYDGHIFLHIAGEGTDDPYLHLYQLTLNDESPVPTLVELPVGVGIQPYILMSAIAVSPDQTKLAYVPFDATREPTSGPSTELLLLDLVTGEKSALGRISEEADPGVTVGYSFSQSAENTIGGTAGPHMYWTSTACVTAMVFASPLPDSSISNETFCE